MATHWINRDKQTNEKKDDKIIKEKLSLDTLTNLESSCMAAIQHTFAYSCHSLAIKICICSMVGYFTEYIRKLCKSNEMHYLLSEYATLFLALFSSNFMSFMSHFHLILDRIRKSIAMCGIYGVWVISYHINPIR